MRRSGLIVVSMLVAMSGGLAFGQDGEPGLLEGPKVERAPATEPGTFGPNKRRGKQQQERPGQKARAFGQAVRVLVGERAPADVRASAEQAEQIKGIMGKHREQMKAFLDANKEEIAALREQGGLPAKPDRSSMEPGQRSGREAGDRGPRRGKPARPERPGQGAMTDGERPARGRAERTPPTPEQKEARGALKKLMEGAPKFEPVGMEVLKVLDEDQRVFVKERAKKMLERGRRGAMGGRMSPEMRERLKDMSPQERREAMRELRDRLGPGLDEPAMDELDLPKPEGG